ncbi:MAG TPA: hypothetical protein VE377_16715 [Candidatus Dormibacteraeota bacterium]|nr:hypothetical protein [Candidatus Dormibacteraeota bacterium]
MSLSPAAQRTIQITVLVIVIAAAMLAALRLHARHEASAAPVPADRPVALPPPGQPRPETAPLVPDPSEALAFATLADSEIDQLPERITFGKWVGERGQNEGWERSKDDLFNVCRSYVKTVALASGRRTTVTASFYPPEPPTPAVFPTLTGQELIDSGCFLANSRIETRAVSEADGGAFARTLQQHFASRYGASMGLKGTGYFGSAYWLEAGRWKSESEVVTAFDPKETDHAGQSPDAGAVFALASLHLGCGSDRDLNCEFKTYRYRPTEEEQFKQAMAMSGANAELSGQVTILFNKLFQGTSESEQAQQLAKSNWQPLLVPALRDWLTAIKPLPPPQRAAGLYVADRLLAIACEADPNLAGGGRAVGRRPELEKLGATFDFDELGDSYVYSSNWMKQARELDPESKVGQMATLIWLVHGGLGFVATQHDFFRKVIADGEWLLTQNLDAPTAAQVHFIVGDAYSDIVTLAGGGEPLYGEPATYQAEAGSARVKALEHYRAGLAVDGTSQTAKDAWLQAWKISAGMLPDTRFVYLYD